MSRPHPSQHPAVSDMQFWQQKLMYRQLQDLQRQQQLQQLDNGARQQNPLNQLSASTKPVSLNQPEMMNEMPTHNVPNYMWPTNFVGPAVPDNSHMLVPGNMNWPNLASSPAMHNIANGFIVSNDQSSSMRYFPNQSFHGIPLSNTRGSTNHNSQLSEMPNDSNNLMTKESGSQSENVSGQFNSFQNNQHFIPQSCLDDRNLGTPHNFQGKGFFGHASMEMCNDDTSVNFRQMNDVQSGQNQVFHVRQEQPDWSGDMQEKPEEQVGTSKYVASLDPTEQKFLFGTDDDNWGASFSGSISSGAGGFLQGLRLANDYLGGFPSIQSGSWSALMQEAVQSSTSDKETQEEWSGLDFHKMEHSMFKPSVMSSDNGKQLTAWSNSNLQSASLTTKPLTLFNDIEAGPSSSNAPTFHTSFETTPAVLSGTQTDASHLAFQLSSRHTSDKQFHQAQKQNQLPEVGQVQVPENNEMWVGQACQQKENSSSEMQHIQGGWTQQQDLHMSNIAKRASNRPNDWNSNYQGRVGNSRFSGDENIQSFATNHVNMDSGVQSVGNSIAQVHSEGSFLGNYGHIPTLNAENNQQMSSSQNVVFGKMFALDSCINSDGEQNAKRGHNQQSGRHQNWELSTRSVNERLGDNYDNNKVHPKMVSGEGYVSNKSYGHQSNTGNGEKEISSLIGHDQHSNLHENHKPATHSDKQTVGYNIFQNQMSNVGMNVESSYPGRNVSHFQGASNSITQGSKTEGNIFTGNSKFNGPIFSNATMDITKRTTVTRTDEPQSSDAILGYDSMSIDRSAINYSQSKNIAQTSQNMLELLHKVDHSGNCSNVPETDKSSESVVNTPSSLFNQSSGMQGFGLQLAPPSQRQQRPHFALSSQMSINNVKTNRFNQEARDNDQMPSTYAPPRRSLPSNEASERDNVPNISGERHKESSESGEQLRSPLATVSGLPYLTNEQQKDIPSGKTFLLHQQHQKQTVSSSIEHEVSRRSVEVPIGNQTNEHAVRNSSPQWKSFDGVASGQSVPASLPTPVREVPPSRLVPLADTHGPANSKSPSLVTDNMKKMVAGFPQVQNSSPFTEGRSGLQPSVSGVAQQAGFSRMLQNLWSNISVQQRLAGLQPAKLTPQLLQSILKNNGDTSSWGLQKGDDQGSKCENTPEMGPGYYNMSHGDEHLIKSNFLKPPRANVDSVPKSVTSSQGEEVTQGAPPIGGSNVSVSSLVRLHQQDMDRGKGGRESAAHFQAVNTSTSVVSSRNSDIGFSGSTSMSLDAQQQNYSLLHQMHAMKGSDSEPSKMSGTSLKGTDDTSNAPQKHWNASQKSANVQNPSFHVPSDNKISASSQDEHDLPNSMQAHCATSAANSLLGTEQTQMVPSWFEKYGNYKNGAVVAGNINCQLSVNAPAQQYLIPKIPRMGYNPVVDQKSDGNEILTHGKITVPANLVTSSEISSYILRPTVLDHGIDQRSKKRKRSTPKLPWHKLITEGPLRLLSISTRELDWAQAANRLIEKVGDDSETMEDSLSLVRSRKRLILTTQLAQQLLPAVPARILREEASSSYESMVFCVAKDVLAEACGMLSHAARNSDANLENQSWTTKELKISVADNVVEDFIERSKKLESDFLRSEKKASLLDVRLECQELERFSIVNRLGKFHGRPHTDVVEGSLNPEAASRRTFVQRYVTAHPPPGSPPEGIACFSI